MTLIPIYTYEHIYTHSHSQTGTIAVTQDRNISDNNNSGSQHLLSMTNWVKQRKPNKEGGATLVGFTDGLASNLDRCGGSGGKRHEDAE